MLRALVKLRVQLMLLVALCSVQWLSNLAIIPPTDDLSRTLVELLERGGFGLIALFSFIENLPGVNVYFPGSVVLVTRMSLTAGYPGLALLTYLAIVIPAVAANMLSFWLGRRLAPRAEGNLLDGRALWIWYLSTYWHPQLAAMTALASGSSGIPFRRFASHFLPISLALSILWAIALYSIGSVGTLRENVFPLAWAYLALWMAWDIYKLLSEIRRGGKRNQVARRR